PSGACSGAAAAAGSAPSAISSAPSPGATASAMLVPPPSAPPNAAPTMAKRMQRGPVRISVPALAEQLLRTYDLTVVSSPRARCSVVLVLTAVVLEHEAVH